MVKPFYNYNNLCQIDKNCKNIYQALLLINSKKNIQNISANKI